ncbi:transcriptional regulator, AraC family [Clostridiales bacterium oral taxon 876 str. F0540]|nr:transcriptional regulator, AraC family [Clostridiales bacterium oral taxon 876 str. F0540]
MNQWEKVAAVQKMQDYIKRHIDEEIKLCDIAEASGYSLRHAVRIFKELLGRTPFDYIRAIRLTDGAKNLLRSKDNILDIAFDTHFDTHEGFIRAFSNEFGITPQKYRQEKPPIKYFVQYPIKHYYSYLNDKEKENMEKENLVTLCTVSIVERPKRKLLIMRAKKAHDYWSFCEECGCDWVGLFNSIECRLDNAAILELPNKLITAGTTNCAAGVELPFNYDGKIPEGCACIELPECSMMYFQTEPFENEDDFGKAIGSVFKAIDNYKPKQYGFEYDFESAPKYNYGASKEMGAKQAVPVKKL